jgi:DNA-binding response OmpR family regulator
MKRVLITEDDPMMAEIYRDTLEGEGFSAEIACDGAVAIRRLKVNPPDIVLLDLMMPNVNGVEVLKHIRAQESTRSLPVVVMSNGLADHLGKQAASAGATRLFSKNACGPRRLVEEVRNVLAAIPDTTETASSSADTTETASSSTDPTKPVVEFRKSVTGSMPQRLADIRDLLHFLAAEGPVVGQKKLLDLYKAIHQLAGIVSFAGFGGMAQLACALEMLFKEFYSTPDRINESSLRTAAQGVEVLAELSDRTGRTSEDGMPAALVMVVDDEPIARDTTSAALEQIHLRAVCVDSPMLAFRLAEENRFDLIFMDAEMPELDGFRACQKILMTRKNVDTPVIIFTTHNDTSTRVRFNSCGATDFISKPLWLTELGVKALTHLTRRQHAKPRAS